MLKAQNAQGTECSRHRMLKAQNAEGQEATEWPSPRICMQGAAGCAPLCQSPVPDCHTRGYSMRLGHGRAGYMSGVARSALLLGHMRAVHLPHPGDGWAALLLPLRSRPAGSDPATRLNAYAVICTDLYSRPERLVVLVACRQHPFTHLIACAQASFPDHRARGACGTNAGGNPVISSQTHKFMGIRNGIDMELWDPETNPFLPKPFNADSVVEGKAAARRVGGLDLGGGTCHGCCLAASHCVHRSGLAVEACH